MASSLKKRKDRERVWLRQKKLTSLLLKRIKWFVDTEFGYFDGPTFSYCHILEGTKLKLSLTVPIVSILISTQLFFNFTNLSLQIISKNCCEAFHWSFIGHLCKWAITIIKCALLNVFYFLSIASCFHNYGQYPPHL